jgi:hypothetical protein
MRSFELTTGAAHIALGEPLVRCHLQEIVHGESGFLEMLRNLWMNFKCHKLI